jgi:protein tyrosine phosphatase (PTP) superfamily phosphohydrolase (DUF442 family)
MMNGNSLLVGLAFTVLCLSISPRAAAQQDLKFASLPNFHRVNDNLYRGGQPKRGGIDELKKLGIKAIIDLRENDERKDEEERLAVAAGIRFFNVPLSNINRPKDEQVERILALINASENQPVFVHCNRGSDRTGTIIAVYRIVHDEWDVERAKKEAKQFGMGWWQISMKDYINDYYKRQNERGQKPDKISGRIGFDFFSSERG